MHRYKYCKLIQFVLIALFVCICNVLALAQEITSKAFKRLTTDNGLINDNIYSIIQDQMGFLWIGTMEGLSRYDAHGFVNFYYHPEDSLSLRGNRITCLFEDSRGILWIGTKGNGLLTYDKYKEAFIPFQHTQISSKASISMIHEDSQHRLWIATAGSNLYVFDPVKHSFKHYTNNITDSVRLSGGRVKDMHETEKGDVWLATGNGLNKWHRRVDSFSHYFTNIEPERQSILNKIFVDKAGTFWLGTNNGVIYINPITGYSESLYPSGYQSNCSENVVNDIWQLSDSTLWFGTRSGLYEYDIDSRAFNLVETGFRSSKNGTPIGVNTFFEDAAGTLWLGTTEGLVQWLPQNLVFKGIHYREWTVNNDLVGIAERGDSLFIANKEGLVLYVPGNDPQKLIDTPLISVFVTKSGTIYAGGAIKTGFFTIDPEIQIVEHYPWGPLEDKYSPSGGDYLCFAEDYLGNIWIGTSTVLNHFNPHTKEFIHITPTPDSPGKLSGYAIADILIDHNQNLWIVSENGLHMCSLSELYAKNLKEINFKQFFHSYSNPHSLSCDQINVLLEDQKGHIWIGTRSGLNKYIPSTDSFIRYSIEDGMAGNFVRVIEGDDHGNLWIGFANLGLSHLDVNKDHFTNYTISEGLIDETFLNGSSEKLTDGSIVLGSEQGMIHFHPDSLLKKNHYIPPVFITGLEVNNVNVSLRGDISLLDTSIIFAPQIFLRHGQNNFRIKFSALNFISPEKNRYMYKLDGVDKEWQMVDDQHSVPYRNLYQNNYTFRVKGSNNDGKWNEKEALIKIRIFPPWWNSPIAWVIYFLTGISLLYRLYQYQLSKNLAKEETRKYKEMDKVKNELFANISHEFRTPLTVIQGLVDELSLKEGSKDYSYQKVILQNTRHLSKLVSQMLLLSRLQSRSIKSKPLQDNIVDYMTYLCGSLKSYARIKGVELTFQCTQKNVLMDFDPDHIQSILYNLISNGIKHTPKGGKITVRLEVLKGSAIIQVQDTGKGISQKYLPYIFNRYYQVGNQEDKIEGTGIGLALTKQLVELNNGSIGVTSEEEKGTVFTIQLPITHNAELVAYQSKAQQGFLVEKYLTDSDPVIMPLENSNNNKEDVPLILIVEDNPDVAYYLSTTLHETYRLAFAQDGREGIKFALELIPDLIICDVMMPVKDGFEVCEELKTNEVTNHIPIILLTARADQDSKLEGFRHKADSYLSKPVHKEELLLIIKNYLQAQQNLREKYQLQSASKEVLVTTDTDPFVQKVTAIIEEKYQDAQFNTTALERELGMSRAQLYRKFKAISGGTPAKLIHKIRLEQAKKLLIHTKKHVSEIAYDVGYKDPGNFTKKFYEYVGKNPNEMRRDLTDH